MVRGKGKFRPQRGGPRRFTSTRDPDAYIRNRPSDDSEEEESGSEVESGSEEVSNSESESGHEVVVFIIAVEANHGGRNLRKLKKSLIRSSHSI